MDTHWRGSGFGVHCGPCRFRHDHVESLAAVEADDDRGTNEGSYEPPGSR